MRFLQSEYKPIVDAIKKAGFIESDFSFVKKKGKLNINHLTSGKIFFFFRKTETVLNEEKKWEKRIHYKFGIDKEEVQEMKEWRDVNKAVIKWLASLKS